MSSEQALNTKEISDVMENAIDTGITCVMSHLTQGKWHRIEVKIDSISRKSLMVELITSPAAGEPSA